MKKTYIKPKAYKRTIAATTIIATSPEVLEDGGGNLNGGPTYIEINEERDFFGKFNLWEEW